jgi:hypothetical protein
LLRRPVQAQPAGHNVAQRAVQSKRAGLGTQTRLPRQRVSVGGAVRRAPAVPLDLSADSRWRTTDTSRDRTTCLIGGDPARDVFAFGQRQRLLRTMADAWADSSALREQVPNRSVITPQCPRNLPHAVSRFPAAPHVCSLGRAQLPPVQVFPYTPPRFVKSRWCCIDPLRPPSS